MKKILIICFVALGCITGSGFASTIDITDMAGRKLTVPYKPEKIICIGPGALRLIVYLQAHGKLAGVEDMEKLHPGGRPYRLANPEFAGLPRIGPGGAASINKKPDLEAVLSVNPDLIFITQYDVSLADSLQKQLNIPVVILSYGALATFDQLTIYESLRLAGKILDRNKRAKAVIDFIESAAEELSNRTKNIEDKEKPNVFVGGISMRGSQGIESSEKNYIPLKWVNARNIVENILASKINTMASKGSRTEGSHIFLDKETLLSLNPDIIFIDGGGVKLIEQDIIKKPEYYRALKAFEKKRVYVLLPFNFYTTNIETALADAFAIAKILYPEQFKDIDAEKKCDEIYTFMVGKPVYSQMKKDFGKIGGIYEF
ncbi:MAG: iron ABC transporter substrate-binding protein [Desulfamplus sp.]|nr:iron ABC transporter substrate-binding protein [Desulfamplus sp.]